MHGSANGWFTVDLNRVFCKKWKKINTIKHIKCALHRHCSFWIKLMKRI